jgi:hypothetical protein
VAVIYTGCLDICEGAGSVATLDHALAASEAVLGLGGPCPLDQPDSPAAVRPVSLAPVAALQGHGHALTGRSRAKKPQIYSAEGGFRAL